MACDQYLHRAIHSGDLARALGGSGRNGRNRNIPGLMQDATSALQHAHNVLTIEQVRYRLDLDSYSTRRVLDDLRVSHHEGYVGAASVLKAMDIG